MDTPKRVYIGRDVVDAVACDSCQALFAFADLIYTATFNATVIDPEEGTLLCGECTGETE